MDDDLADVPVCTWPGGVEYRPLPGWSRYRVASNRTVWFNATPAGRPPPWDRPRWRRVKARGGRVRLQRDGRQCERSAELLFRAAFDPGSLSCAELARLGPERLPAKSRPVVIVPHPLPRRRSPRRPPRRQIRAITSNLRRSSRMTTWPTDPRRGSAHGRARLDEAKVLEARRLHAEGWGIKALAARFGVGKVTMHYALAGKTWTHVPRLPAKGTARQ